MYQWILNIALHIWLFPNMQNYKAISVWDHAFVSTDNYILLHAQTTLIQFKASVAKPWTKLRLVVYTCNYHPGTVLSGSWHPKHRLPRSFLITLIILLILFAALLLITSWEQASGKQSNTHSEKSRKSSHCNLVANTDQMQIWAMHLCGLLVLLRLASIWKKHLTNHIWYLQEILV